MRLRGLHGIDLVEINYVECQVLPQNNAHIILKILPTQKLNALKYIHLSDVYFCSVEYHL